MSYRPARQRADDKILTRQQLWARLNKEEIAPVYTLFGHETYLRDRAAKTITDKAFAESDLRDFNDDQISLSTPDNLRNALASANQLPMMAERRVVRITEVKVAATSNKDTLKEEHFDRLSEYLENPSPSSVVIFVASELNGNRKIGKLLREKSTAVEFPPLDDEALEGLARRDLGSSNAEMGEQTIRHLIATIGPNAGRLQTEIEKLATAALPATAITIELIDALVANVRETSNFALTDHIAAKDKKRALQTLRKILDDGAEPLALLGLIAGNYHRMLLVKSMMEQGAGQGSVKSAARAGFGWDKFLAASRRTDKNVLIKGLQLMAATDVAIKTSVGGSSPHGPRLMIEMLVCELTLA